MLDEILPSWVATAELFGDPPDITLFPEEEALVSDSADKRRREFRTSRHCAHLALRRLGVAPRPVLRGERGAPAWPPGVVGSITHCAGYRAAAVACGALSIGIDAEPHLLMPRGVLERTATPAEAAALDLLDIPDPGRLLFSAKEAIYKAWHPLTGQWLGFLDATVTFTASPSPSPDPPAASGTFAAEIAVHGPGWPTRFEGRWLVSGGLIVTAIAVPTPSA
ncbi:4'-phosphopantetheinyl transferase superfamily protein [Nonomuraea sp. NPDC003709]|uniref:4'-phosphopantetheinyl transferase family protein n=1 Tax=Nonomuraea sp. NPDC003709 TaxID=3154450 RepID=UPI0033B6BCDA